MAPAIRAAAPNDSFMLARVEKIRAGRADDGDQPGDECVVERLARARPYIAAERDQEDGRDDRGQGRQQVHPPSSFIQDVRSRAIRGAKLRQDRRAIRDPAVAFVPPGAMEGVPAPAGRAFW